MTVKIRLFAMMAEEARTRELTFDVPESTKVEQVCDLMKAKFSTLAWPPGTVVAVNQEYAGGRGVLHEGDEIAIIPPVSGG